VSKVSQGIATMAAQPGETASVQLEGLHVDAGYHIQGTVFH